jgi:acetylornithine deacetylase/succinyl-diaminopimelate desuccinylase-like protein
MRRFWSAAAAAVAIALVSSPTSAQTPADDDALADASVELLLEYLSVDTTNPPGNESRAVDFFARILELEGIRYETAESAPGRGNIWARLEGGSEPALLLLHHSDVVPADPAFWDTPPLAGEIVDGHVYGRGTLDTKTLGILHLQAFLALHRSGRPLNRDVIFMATADEEAGGFYGVGWLVENRPEAFEGVGVVLNEGGRTLVSEAGAKQVGIEVTQKVPVWLRLVASGVPGHGSRPRAESAVTELLEALDRVREHESEPRLLPVVDRYFQGISEARGEEWAELFLDMASSIREPGFMARLQDHDPTLAALTRNTCSITRLHGSGKINVVPPTAAAELDCRVLPDQDVGAFVAEIQRIAGEEIEVQTMMAFTAAISPTDTHLYATLEAVMQERFPDAVVVPAVSSGFTDSHFLRDLGIAAYGYTPLLVPVQDQAGVHGNNERISIENVRRGTEIMRQVVERVALD